MTVLSVLTRLIGAPKYYAFLIVYIAYYLTALSLLFLAPDFFGKRIKYYLVYQWFVV